MTIRDLRWPSPPPWRAFRGGLGPDQPPPPDDDEETARRLGAVAPVLLSPERISLINAAVYLRRPLLVTGSPGVGKSTLAELIARELRLGRVLRWPITSRSTLRAGLFEFDAVGRAQAALQYRGQAARRRFGLPLGEEPDVADRGGPTTPAAPPVGDFLHLGPLGTALLPYRHPRVLLIDELDKGDFDLPNDLLNVFEEGEFSIAELLRVRAQTPDVKVHTADPNGLATISNGRVRCREFPIVVITSNGEREFPPAFLRRCVTLQIPDPTIDQLAALIAAHFPDDVPDRENLVAQFVRRRGQVGPLAADQLLNAAYLATVGAREGDEAAWTDLVEAVWHRLAPGAEPG